MRLPYLTLCLTCLTFWLSGCSSGPSRIESVTEGMTKAEVVAVLGEPRHVSPVAGSDFLTYKVWRSFWRRAPGNYTDIHYVKFTNGRVVQYGDIRTLTESTRSMITE